VRLIYINNYKGLNTLAFQVHQKLKYNKDSLLISKLNRNIVAKEYHDKVIISGDIIEFYHYEKPQKRNKSKAEQKENKVPVADWILEGRKPGKGDAWEPEEYDLVYARFQNARRGKNKVRRLINSNVYQYIDKNNKKIIPKFLTLTFADNVQEVSEANKIFSNFIHEINRKIFGRKDKRGLKYLVVMEFQLRGAIHYHVIFFNLPYVKTRELQRIWGQGIVHIKKLNNVDNIGAYISKYLTKDYDDDRLDGKKRYFTSCGLIKPYIEIDIKKIDLLKRSMLEKYKVFDSTFQNVFTGQLDYLQYNLRVKNIQ